MSKEPKRNVYVGHRYVPLIMGEWDQQETYEGLSIVTHEGGSFTSKKRVPVGIDILDTEYWVHTGNYNAQVEQYRQDVVNMKDHVENEVNTLKDYVENEAEHLNEQVKQITVKEDKGVDVSLLGLTTGLVDQELLTTILDEHDKLFFPTGVYDFNSKFIYELTERKVLNGANVIFRYIGNEHVENFIYFSLNGYDFDINGINFDSHFKANKGLMVFNDSFTSSILTVNLSTSKHTKRILSFVGGEPYNVKGNFDKVIFNEVEAYESTAEIGSGVAGSQGVTGITASHIDVNRYVKQLIVNDSLIDEVIGEGYGNIDQDGIRHLSPHNVKSETIVRRTKIKNTRGRAIKCQTSLLDIDDIEVDQDVGYGGGVIENQRGSVNAGKVSYRIKETQDNLIRFGGNEHFKTFCNVDSLNVNGLVEGLKLRSFVYFYTTINMLGVEGVNINNIVSNVEAEQVYGMTLSSGIPVDNEVNVVVNNVDAKVSGNVVYTFANPEESFFIVHANVSNVHNRIVGERALASNIYSEVRGVSLYNVKGFTDQFHPEMNTFDLIRSQSHSDRNAFKGSTIHKVYEIEPNETIDIGFGRAIGSGYKVEIFAHVSTGYASAYYRSRSVTEIFNIENGLIAFIVDEDEPIPEKLNYKAVMNDSNYLINKTDNPINVMVRIESVY